MKGKTEFAVFCVESIAKRLNISARDVYLALTERSDILYGYVIASFDVLHTQSKEYIVNDILSVMKEAGVLV